MSQAGQFFQNGAVGWLTGDAGGAVGPTAGNINILGGAGIGVTGNPGTSTLTIAHSGVFADSFPTDAGTAVPAAGDTDILGGTNINTTGAGNTVTVILDDSVTLVGSLTAGTTLVAGTGLGVTTGDVNVSAGDLYVAVGFGDFGTTVTAGTGLIATTGGVLASAGNVVATLGNITADAGNVTATLGNGDFGGTCTAGTGLIATTGGVLASAGNIVATLGGITADAGNITATLGNVVAGAALTAGTTLTVGTTVTFTSITDGGLIADASGVVSASEALTLGVTGFNQWSGGGPYFDDTTLGQFEVSEGGSGYIDGVYVSWASGQTVTGLLAGNTYLIYMDDTGTIGKTTTFNQTIFEQYIPLFECLRDSTGTNVQYTVKENHPFDFKAAISFYCHEVIGTVIENHNNGANITLNGTQKIEIVGADDLSDHGLYTDIPDGGGVAETFKQMYTDGGGKWATYVSSDTFNGFWNSAGTATAPSGTKYSVYRLYVSKDNITSSTPTYWAVLHTSEYNNLTAANTAIALGNISMATAELAKLEFAQLGYIVYQQSISTIVNVVIEKSTLLQTISTGGGSNQAALITTNVTNFDGMLSASDTTVQTALDTIDDWGLPQSNIFYVGKHGNDANDGLSINRSFLTFGAAQAAASSGDVVWCSDSGTYTENITGVAGISIFAPNATLVGVHTVTAGNVWTIKQMTVLTATTGITMATASQNAFVKLERMTIAGTGVGIVCTAGTFFMICGSIEIENGFFVGATTADEVQMLFGEIHFTGSGIAFASISGGEIHVIGDSVRNNGGGDGTVFNTTGGGSPVINATIASIDSDKLSNITAGSSVCTNVCSLTGALVESGAGNITVGGSSRIDNVPIGAVTPAAATFTTSTATTSNATTFDTNVAAAGLTLAGTTLSADGTNSDIAINIIGKGTGAVGIGPTLELSNPLTADYGGTGATTLTDHGVLVGSGVGAITPLAVGTNGQVIVGSTGADPVFANIISTDSSISITEGAGTLDLEVAGGAGMLPWTEVTGTTQAMAVGNGYIADNAALVTLTLPATAAVGDIIRLCGKGAGYWTVAQNAGQTIRFHDASTTTGVGGAISTAATTKQWGALEFLCITANTDFAVLSASGASGGYLIT